MTVTRAIVSRLVKKWRKRLELDPKWTFTIAVHKERHEEEEDERDDEAHVSIDPYWRVDLAVNQWFFDDKDERYLEQVIVHELVHVILNPLRTAVMCVFGDRGKELADEMIEQVTEHLARAYVRK